MKEFRMKASVDIIFYAEDEGEFNDMAKDLTDNAIGDAIEYWCPNAAYVLATIESCGT